MALTKEQEKVFIETAAEMNLTEREIALVHSTVSALPQSYSAVHGLRKTLTESPDFSPAKADYQSKIFLNVLLNSYEKSFNDKKPEPILKYTDGVELNMNLSPAEQEEQIKRNSEKHFSGDLERINSQLDARQSEFDKWNNNEPPEVA